MDKSEDGGKSRAGKLDEIGFVWHTGAIKPSFEGRLDECREFRRNHDHLRIPQPAKYSKEDQSAYESREERSFLQWAQRQRDEYRKHKEGLKSSLDKNRIRKLDELGFEWDGDKMSGSPGQKPVTRGKPKNHVAFNERIQVLKVIKEKYGDCNDIKNLKAAGHAEASPLYQWMKAQRKAWKAFKAGRWSSLTAERISILESVEFNFEPRKHYAAYGSKKSDDRARGPAVLAVGGAVVGEHDQQQNNKNNEESSDESDDDENEEEEEEPPRPPLGYEHYRIL